MKELSHLDEHGQANMVDVSNKISQKRRAVANGKIFLSAQTLAIIRDNQIKKGNVLTIAQIAGIQAAKQTAHLIPLCHPLTLNKIDVRLQLAEDGITAESRVLCVGRTGVEMEALTAVAVALLTVYDMCKAVDRNMHVGEIRLIEKVKENV